MSMDYQTTKPERIKNYNNLYQGTARINCKTGKVK